MVITGRGGRHLWFKYIGPIQCSTGRVAPHVDVRGDGGYAVAPSSVHENGRAYRWATDPKHELAIAPDWLVDLTRKKATISERARVYAPPGAICSSAAYGAAALNAELATLAAAQPGTRNHALNRCSFVLFQLVAGGELDGGTVEGGLLRACEHNGLIADDGLHSVEKTIASGRRSGLQFPRSRSGRFE
jgi:putative DNA primase/helicase